MANPAAKADYGTGEKTLAIYFLGFFLCLVLTAIPFAAVKYAEYSYAKNVWHIFIAAIIQFFVQVICFLRMNCQTNQAKWNVMSFVFAGIVTFVLIGGSIWIMWNLNYNMMH